VGCAPLLKSFQQLAVIWVGSGLELDYFWQAAEVAGAVGVAGERSFWEPAQERPRLGRSCSFLQEHGAP
jgi:hypothetical protein